MKVPEFMLKQLYKGKSLKNGPDGFEFVIKNTLMDGTVAGPLQLAVDDKPIPPEKIVIFQGENSWESVAISKANPLPLKVNVEVTVRVKGETLKPGEHALAISTLTKEFGDIGFTIKDSV